MDIAHYVFVSFLSSNVFDSMISFLLIIKQVCPVSDSRSKQRYCKRLIRSLFLYGRFSSLRLSLEDGEEDEADEDDEEDEEMLL